MEIFKPNFFIYGLCGAKKKIIENMPEGYEHREIRSKPPEWSGIEEIEALSDNDRALVTSEARDLIGEWLVITPSMKVEKK